MHRALPGGDVLVFKVARRHRPLFRSIRERGYNLPVPQQLDCITIVVATTKEGTERLVSDRREDNDVLKVRQHWIVDCLHFLNISGQERRIYGWESK